MYNILTVFSRILHNNWAGRKKVLQLHLVKMCTATLSIFVRMLTAPVTVDVNPLQSTPY